MAAITKFPNVTFNSSVQPPLPAKVLEGLTTGAVALMEFNNPNSPVTTFPANGATVPDLSDAISKNTNGGTSFGAFPVTSSIAGGSVLTKTELTGRGAPHVMVTQVNHPGVSPYETFRIGLGAARVAYLNAAILAGHPVIVTCWWRDTRVPNATFTDAEMFAGLSRSDPSGALATTASNRLATIGVTNAQLATGPAATAVGFVKSTTRRDGSGAGQYSFCAAITSQLTTFTTLTSGLSTGAAITSLPVATLTASVPNGTTVQVKSGANVQTFTVSATAAVGATALTVTSATPTFAFPTGSTLTVVFTIQDRLLSLGANASTFANKLGSRAVMRIYVEDLALTGRTHDQVAAIDQGEYVDQVLGSSGRWYADTWSNPATALP